LRKSPCKAPNSCLHLPGYIRARSHQNPPPSAHKALRLLYCQTTQPCVPPALTICACQHACNWELEVFLTRRRGSRRSCTTLSHGVAAEPGSASVRQRPNLPKTTACITQARACGLPATGRPSGPLPSHRCTRARGCWR